MFRDDSRESISSCAGLDPFVGIRARGCLRRIFRGSGISLVWIIRAEPV
jgi:hypothetical protein